MRRHPRRPTPDELSCHPELAALAALDLMLDLAVAALLARHPEIGLDVPYDSPATLVCSVAEAADALRLLVRRYRAVLARHNRNIPF